MKMIIKCISASVNILKSVPNKIPNPKNRGKRKNLITETFTWFGLKYSNVEIYKKLVQQHMRKSRECLLKAL